MSTQNDTEDTDFAYQLMECCACAYTVFVTTKNEKGEEHVVMAGGFLHNPTGEELRPYKEKADKYPGGNVTCYTSMVPTGYKVEGLVEPLPVSLTSKSQRKLNSTVEKPFQISIGSFSQAGFVEKSTEQTEEDLWKWFTDTVSCVKKPK